MTSGSGGDHTTEDGRPFFSILMPAYNREALIMAALDSVLSQTDVSLELVAVDDGSTDSTGAILDAVAARDSRLRVFHHESNRGEGYACNTGLDELRGEWLIVLHSDDVLIDGALFNLAERLRKSDADLVFTRTTRFGLTGWRLVSESSFSDGAVGNELLSFDPQEAISNGLLRSLGRLDGKLFRLGHLRTCSTRFQQIERVADVFFVCSAFTQARKVEFIDSELILYRTHAADSMTALGEAHPTAFIQAVIGIREMLVERGLWEAWGRTVLDLLLRQIDYNLYKLRSFRAYRSFVESVRHELVPTIGDDYRRFAEQGMPRCELYEKIAAPGWGSMLDTRGFLERKVSRGLSRVRRRLGIKKDLPDIPRGVGSPLICDAEGFPVSQRKRAAVVSVIVVARNSATALPACLDSLVAQTYAGFEVVLVDDGSTDGTAELARTYAERDKRIRVVALPESGGPVAARRSGLEAARGEWAAFVDATDLVLPDYLSALLGAAIGSSADMSLCAMTLPGAYTLEGVSLHPQTILRTGEELARMPDGRGYRYSAAWGKLFKRSVLSGLCASDPLALEDGRGIAAAVRACGLTAESGKGLYRRSSSPAKGL